MSVKEQVRGLLIAGESMTYRRVREMGGDSAMLAMAVEEVAAMGYPVRKETADERTGQVAFLVSGCRAEHPSAEAAVAGLKALVERRKALQREDRDKRREMRRRAGLAR